VHTIIVIGVGVLLLGLCLLVGRFVGEGPPAVAGAALVFVPLWFIGAAINLWIGVSRAGYSVADEAPIFVLVFAIPVALALIVRRRLAA
jgi:hypothetical protein